MSKDMPRYKGDYTAPMDEWMAWDLSHLDLLVIQIAGLQMTDKLLMIGAVGIDIGRHACTESCFVNYPD